MSQHQSPTGPSPARSRRTAGAVAAVLLTGLVGGGAAWAALRDDAPFAAPVDTAAATEGDPRVQGVVDSLVEELEFPGALAHVVDEDGVARDYTAGVGNLETGAEVPVDGEVRIASNTKTFTAAVVLQLVGEGSVDLDAPIETYLPGLVRGEGIDGNAITVRQLLQHTSGLPNYTAVTSGDSFATRDRYVPARDLTDIAFAEAPLFAPGEGWSYSNTNYTLLGMLIERVTGRPYAEQVTERIIEPLGLEHTYVPDVGEREIRGAHPRGYHPTESGELEDLTEMDPSIAGAAGMIVSTPSELAAFFTALVGGELLEPAQLEAMQQMVEMPEEYPGDGYGLGLMRTTLSCGVVLWGHGGDIEGYATRGGVTEDGVGVTYAVTSLGSSLETIYAMEDKVDEIVCGA
ncbi:MULTISPECIES: serine hydrolase [unclassified Actinotalea]|uniref:serine hydrolase domain-containing protein n=1 Tax=unclassified Actinotalea TaxID=2638618 RepID=UPI0015F74D26|nr:MULTISPECIES: serine hydrolase domain-containing protein [unclassified Actinotalea]